MRMLSLIMLLFITAFMWAGTASAIDFSPQIHTATIGVTTGPMLLEKHSPNELGSNIAIDVQWNATLLKKVPLVKQIATTGEVRYTKIDVNDLDNLTGRPVKWKTGVFAQPFRWLRSGAELKEREFDRALMIEYTFFRIGKHF